MKKKKEMLAYLSQHKVSDQYRPASEMPFKWCFAGGSIVAHLLMLLKGQLEQRFEI